MIDRTVILDRPQRAEAYIELFCALAAHPNELSWGVEFACRALGRLLVLDCEMVRNVIQGYEKLRDGLNLEAAIALAPFLDEALEEQSRRRSAVFEKPLSYLERCDDPEKALAVAEAAMAQAREDIAELPAGPEWSWDGRRRLRLGYVCSDLRYHPVGFSVRSMLFHHDRARFEVHFYDRTGEPERVIQGPVRLAAERFNDCRNIPASELAVKIRSDRIDILVDLSGAPLIPENDVLCRRPAPVRVSMIGFPGAVGRDAADYTVADHVVVPARERAGFSECLIYMPGSFLPVDDQVEEEPVPPRAALGLPEDAFVMAAFNRFSKITMTTLRIWFSCLQRIPESVLWVAPQATDGEHNLRRLAQRIGFAPERLVFAERLGIKEHLARMAAADVALDPAGYNGGHTSALALARKVPVVTLPGRSFAWRMSASILTAAGLPEGIADSPTDYIARVERLATDPEWRAEWQSKLRGAAASDFFSTAKYVKALEAALLKIAENRSSGRPDEDIEVTPSGRR